MRRSFKTFLIAGTAIATLTSQAFAGAFYVREQSTYGQGAAFAGIAAGGSPSSMFWNPATMTQNPGLTTQWDMSLIVPNAVQTATSGTLLSLGVPQSDQNTGGWAVIPASYTIYQLSPNMWVGLSVNSPFGLASRFRDPWPGRDYGQSSYLKSYNAAPSFAWKVNEWLSIGAGFQIQYARVDLNQGLILNAAPLVLGSVHLEGTGWAYGATAGVTLTPMPGTQIGIGWRSALNQEIDGKQVLPTGVPGTNGSIHTVAKEPDIVSGGLRQRLTETLTLLGTVEWTNWSRIGTSTVKTSGGAVANINGTPVLLPFQYKDGWFYSAGFEYLLTTPNGPATFRAGIAYEDSPITDRVRIPLLPDNDRIWFTVGGSYPVNKQITLDFAYTHIWVRDTHIDVSSGSGNPWFNAALGSYVGDTHPNINIISVGIKWRWDEPPKALITKG